MSFSKLLTDSKEDSRSNICVGLDLAVYGSRKENTLQRGEDKTKIILNLIIRDRLLLVIIIKNDWGYLDVTMPKNKAFDYNFNLLERLFERFPNAFPMLRHLLEL